MRRFIQIVGMSLWLGSTVFGGVSVAYPQIRTWAEEVGGLSSEKVAGLYALAVFLPGPSFLNLWGEVAGEVGGPVGAVVGEIALLLPAFVLTLLLPLVARLPYFGTHVAGAMQGGIWATVGLMAATGVDSLRKVKGASDWFFMAAGLGLMLLGLHPLLVMVLLMLAGIIRGYWQPGEEATGA
ncbi:MAG: chromate transporter [Mycobacterium leprae]